MVVSLSREHNHIASWIAMHRLMLGTTKSTGGLSAGDMSTFENPLAQFSMAGDNELLFDPYNGTIFSGASQTIHRRTMAENGHTTDINETTRNNNDEIVSDKSRDSRKKTGFLPSGMSLLKNNQRSQNKSSSRKSNVVDSLHTTTASAEKHVSGPVTRTDLAGPPMEIAADPDYSQIISNDGSASFILAANQTTGMGGADNSLALHNGHNSTDALSSLVDAVIGAPAEFKDDHTGRIVPQTPSDSKEINARRKMAPAPPPPATARITSSTNGQQAVGSKQGDAPATPTTITASHSVHESNNVVNRMAKKSVHSSTTLQLAPNPVNNRTSPTAVRNMATVDGMQPDTISNHTHPSSSGTSHVDTAAHSTTGLTSSPSPGTYLTSSYNRAAAEIDTSNSIVKRADFRERLEAVMSSRGSDTGIDIRRPLVEKMRTNGADGTSLDVDQSAGTIISQLFRQALENYEVDDTLKVANKRQSTKGMHGTEEVDTKTGTKFRFPVVGIDVPEVIGTDNSIIPERQQTDTDETTRVTHVRRGFSYLTDVHQAAEVSRRAADVASRKPHESVSTRAVTSPNENQTSQEQEVLQQARARLHHSQFPLPPPPPPFLSHQHDFNDNKITRPTGMLQEMLEKVRSRQLKLNLPSSNINDTIEDEGSVIRVPTASDSSEKSVDYVSSMHAVKLPQQGDTVAIKPSPSSIQNRNNAHGDFGDVIVDLSSHGIRGYDTNNQSFSTGPHLVVEKTSVENDGGATKRTESSRSFLLGSRGTAAGVGEGVAHASHDNAFFAGSRVETAASETPVWPTHAPAAVSATAAEIPVYGYEYNVIDRSHRSSIGADAAAAKSSSVNVITETARVVDGTARSKWSSPEVTATGNAARIDFNGVRKSPTPLSLGFVSSGSGDEVASGTSFSDVELNRVRALTSQTARRRRQLSNRQRESLRYRYTTPDRFTPEAFNEQLVGRPSSIDSPKVDLPTIRVRVPIYVSHVWITCVHVPIYVSHVFITHVRVPISVSRIDSTVGRPVTVEISPDLNRNRHRASAGRRLRNTVQSTSLTSHDHESHLPVNTRQHRSAVVGVVRNPSIVSWTRPASVSQYRSKKDRILQLGYSSDPEKGSSARDSQFTVGVKPRLPSVNWSRNSLTNLDQIQEPSSGRMAVVGWPPVLNQHDNRSLFSPLYVHPVETDLSNGVSRESVNPHLEDVGKSNGSYFVQMKLNASGGDAGITINGGYHSRLSTGANSSNGTTKYQPTNGTSDHHPSEFRHVSVAGHAQPHVPQVAKHSQANYISNDTDDVGSFRNSLTTSKRNSNGGVNSSALGYAENGAHYIITNTSDFIGGDDRRTFRVATGNQVNGSVGSVDADISLTRHSPTTAVSFDVELQSVPDKVTREDQMLLDNHRSTSSHNRVPVLHPRYSLQLNDTLTFDIDTGNTDSQSTRRVKPTRQTQRRRRMRPVDEEILQQEIGINNQWSNKSANESMNRRSNQRTVENGHNKERNPMTSRNIPIQVPNRYPVGNGVSHNSIAEDDGNTSEDIVDLAKHLPTMNTTNLVVNGGISASRGSGGRGRSRQSLDRLPRVVRGSILIRNAIDTTGGPRHVDVVTDGTSTLSGIIVEDNTNMFDGLYRQSRENPMYLSDEEDLADAGDGKMRPSSGRRPQSSSLTEQVLHEEHRMATGTARFDHDDHEDEDEDDGDDVDVMSGDDDFDNEIPISQYRRATNRINFQSSRDSPRPTPSRRHPPLVAAPNGVRQTVDVQRDQEEIIGPVRDLATGTSNAVDELQPTPVNVDAVSEKVDVSLEDGLARITVRVRCERIVPIRGSDDMFKKSAVIVTRVIEIDMMATAERRQLYDNAVGFQGNDEAPGRLNAQDTFELYKILTRIAEHPSGHPDGGNDAKGARLPKGSDRQSLHIESLLEEEQRRRHGNSFLDDDL